MNVLMFKTILAHRMNVPLNRNHHFSTLTETLSQRPYRRDLGKIIAGVAMTLPGAHFNKLYSKTVACKTECKTKNKLQGVPKKVTYKEISSFVVKRENIIEWFMNDRSMYNSAFVAVRQKLIQISRGAITRD
jgi:hypothetical protein